MNCLLGIPKFIESPYKETGRNSFEKSKFHKNPTKHLLKSFIRKKNKKKHFPNNKTSKLKTFYKDINFHKIYKKNTIFDNLTMVSS